MAQTGNRYVIELNRSQLGWGEERHTGSRTPREGEAYLAIPRPKAKAYNLYNSNKTKGLDILGENIFNCTSTDGFLSCEFKSQGCTEKGDVYAKQFSSNDNLTILGNWYKHMHAKVGDKVEVYFLSPSDIQLTLL